MTENTDTQAPVAEVLPPKHAGGRPLKYRTVAELKRNIDDYFHNIRMDDWTITGLALHLHTDRTTLMNYQGRAEFFDTVKTAKTMIEHAYELSLRHNGKATDIFALKNFGWTDQQQVDVTSQGESVVIYRPSKLEDV
jgi:DNA-packaging protein gp3